MVTAGAERIHLDGNGNVGIGTTVMPNGLLSVNGNVGIGTWLQNARLVVMGGNVGVGSLSPGQALDVAGTLRATGFTMSGSSPISGYVLTATDSAGDITWSSAGGVSGWTVTGSNVYETGNGNVGIGTTLLTTSALTVMNGNVGIGTWVPGYRLAVPWGSGDTATTVYFGSTNASDNQTTLEADSYSGRGIYGTSQSNNAIYGQTLAGSGFAGIVGNGQGNGAYGVYGTANAAASGIFQDKCRKL